MRIDQSGNVGIGTTSPGALLDVGKAGTTLGTMRLEGNTSGYLQLQTAAAAGSWTMTLPANAGTNNYVLKTDGSGVTSWGAASATPAGSDKQIQYNNNGVLAASSAMTFSSASPTLTITGDINYTGVLVDTSDRRAKDDIKPLPVGQLDKLMRLQPVSFVMKNDPKRRTELGLIAQDAQTVYPDLVLTDAAGMRSLNYVGLAAPMIKAMQEQQTEIGRLWAGLAVAMCAALVPGFLIWRNRAK